MSGLTSTDAMSGRAVRERESPREHGDQRVAVDRGLAAERAEQRLQPEVVEHRVGVDIGDGHDAERDVAERLGQRRHRSRASRTDRTADRARGRR